MYRTDAASEGTGRQADRSSTDKLTVGECRSATACWSAAARRAWCGGGRMLPPHLFKLCHREARSAVLSSPWSPSGRAEPGGGRSTLRVHNPIGRAPAYPCQIADIFYSSINTFVNDQRLRPSATSTTSWSRSRGATTTTSISGTAMRRRTTGRHTRGCPKSRHSMIRATCSD